jgi:hypothetical protein
MPEADAAVVASVFPDGRVKVCGDRNGELVAAGTLVPRGVAWEPGAAWSSTGERMVEGYLVGIHRVFQDGRVDAEDWTTDLNAQEVLKAPLRTRA